MLNTQCSGTGTISCPCYLNKKFLSPPAFEAQLVSNSLTQEAYLYKPL